METLTPLGAALALAFLAETITEYFFADWLGWLKLDTRYMRYVSALIGVALCLAYGVDLLSDVLGLAPRLGVVGQVLTGLIWAGAPSTFTTSTAGSYTTQTGSAL